MCFIQGLSIDETLLVRAIRDSDSAYLMTYFADRGLQPIAIELECHQIKQEMNRYSSNSDSLLVQTTAEKLSEFSIKKLVDELKIGVPTLVGVKEKSH